MQSSDRYIRQTILSGFGMPAQQKLFAAKVLIVGMGGLGCPALQYLTGAGLGYCGIMDADTISISNLHRQLLFNTQETGQKKVEVAGRKMKALNPDIHIEAYPFALNNNNALDIIRHYDLVIDATDQLPAKYLINDACVLLGKPFIYGAANGYEGQLSVFNLSDGPGRAINYRDLFPIPPQAAQVKTCSETGVLGPLPGMIGTMQAAEAIKLITGIGSPLYGRLFTYNVLQGAGYEIKLLATTQNQPITPLLFEAISYELPCDDMEDIEELNVAEFKRLVAEPGVFVLDVREWNEFPKIDFSDVQIPMSVLKAGISSLPDQDICVICHQGIRSLYAAQLIQAQKKNLTIYSLKGGISAYFNH